MAQLIKNPPEMCGRPGFDLWVEKIPWRGERIPTPGFWPGEFHGLYSPWGRKELDMTQQPALSLSFIYFYWQELFHHISHIVNLIRNSIK